ALHGELHDQALLAAILGDEGQPGLDGGGRVAAAQRSAVDVHLAAVVAVDAEDRPDDLTAAGADESREGDDLAAVHGEADVGEGTVPGQVAHLQARFAYLGGLLGEERRHLATDHATYDLVDGDFVDWVRADPAAVAHDGDALAEREDLVEAVRDEQHRGAGVAQRS